MDSISFYFYLFINLTVLFVYYKRDYGVYQFPFLIACVSLTFVAPQVINLLEYHYVNNSLTIIMFLMCVCNLALFWGFEFGKRYGAQKNYEIEFKGGKYYTFILWIFFLVGVAASLMNRGAYQGGFVSGTFVIISFFAGFINYALLLILIGLKKDLISGKKYWFLIAIIIAVTIDKIVQSGRRAETINLVLTLSYFVMDRDERIYRYLKPIIPLFFFFGMIIGSQIGKYRENSYAGKMTFSENIKSLNFSFDLKRTKMVKGEIYNAFEGINNITLFSAYDYGAFNWNGIVHTYVPTALTGRTFKENLMVNGKGDALKKYLTRSGSTMTGYYDAFASFGVFGFIKFLVIGFFMGVFGNRRNHSQFSLFLYFPLLTPGLHLLTHSSNYFFCELFFIGVAIYPIFRPNLIKTWNFLEH